MSSRVRSRAGEWVEVRSREEILATLDADGRLGGMPFMPEMLAFCGQRLRVYKRAHKTCDTVNGTGGRRLENAVHLEDARCDGSAHGGCQAACLLFWREEWLRPLDGRPAVPAPAGAGIDEETLRARTLAPQPWEGEGPTYVCQATALPEATRPLAWWDVRQYLEDWRSGNVSLRRMLRDLAYAAFTKLVNAGIGLGPPLKWLNDRFPALFGGVPYPRRPGTIPAGERTPDASLGLQPGEWVRIKSYEEIRRTLDTRSRNRGMRFDCEEVPYCGGRYRVRGRVDRLIHEKTGKMLTMKTPSVLLEGVVCQARFSDRRLFCPRAIFSMWREGWLERVAEPGSGGAAGEERGA